MPFPYQQQEYADDTARLFLMRTRNFEHYSQPEMILAKGDMPVEQMGRMIDPFLLPADGGFYLFYKQDGVSCSFSRDLKQWQYLGRTSGGENACVIPYEGRYLLIHSPKNGIAFSIADDLRNWSDYRFTTLDQSRWPWAAGRLTAGFAMPLPANSQYRYALFFHGSRDETPETHGSATLAMAYTNDFRTFVF